MGGFFVLIMGLGFIFSQVYDDPVILYVAVVFSIVMNIVSYFYSDKIALSLSHAKLITREEYPVLWNAVENLSITAGLPMPRVYIINDPSPNAFATGRNAKNSAIAVTTGLLSIMDKNELEGVVAHELAHIGNRDILISTVVVVLVGIVTILSDIFLRSRSFKNDNDNKAGAIIMILAIVSAVLAPLVATLIQLAISRKREYLADSTGVLLTRYPEGLASALEKIGQYSQGLQNPHSATAHLFISNPFGGKALRGMGKLFMTHPPLEDRVKVLRGE